MYYAHISMEGLRKTTTNSVRIAVTPAEIRTEIRALRDGNQLQEKLVI